MNLSYQEIFKAPLFFKLKKFDFYFTDNKYYYLDRFFRPFIIAFFSFFAARSFGPSIFSEICYVQLILSFFIPISTLGLEGIIKRKASKKTKDYLKFTQLALISRLTITFLLVSFFWVFGDYLNSDFNKTYYLLMSLTLFIASTDVIEWMFFGLKKFNKISKIRFLGALLFIPIKIAAIYFGPFFYLFSLLLEAFLISIFFIREYKDYVYAIFPDNFRFIFSKEGLWYVLSGLLIITVAKLDQIILVSNFGKNFLAFYAIPSMIVGFCSSFILTLLTPQLLTLLNKSPKNFSVNSSSIFNLGLRLSLLAFLLIVSFAFFIPLTLGESYKDSISILLILSSNIFINMITSVHSIFWLSKKNSKSVMFLTILTSTATLFFCNVFAYFYGLQGLAIGSVLSNLIGNLFFPFFVKDGKDLMFATYKSFFKVKTT
jgi:O-antigen/teichoic acid export membrane protein